MPTQKDQVLGRLAVDLGYLTHEQIGKAFIDHQMQVQNQGVKVSFAEMLVIQGLLTGDRARELEEAATVEYGGAPPAAASPSTSGRSSAPKKRRRRPTTRSAPPIRRPAPGNQMWIAAAGGAGILLLAVVSYLMVASGTPEDPAPPETGTDAGPVTETATAAKPPKSTRVTLTPVTKTLVTETPRAIAPEVDRSVTRPEREPKERGTVLTADDGAVDTDPGIAEMLSAARAAAAADALRTDTGPPETPTATGISQGLVGHWTFDEGRGTVVMDMSGNGANGTIKGGTWTRGRIGGALEFDGRAHVEIANESAFDIYDKISVSAWVKVTGGWKSAWQSFVSKCGERDQGWQLRRMSGTDGICFTLRGTSAKADAGGGVTTIGSDGLWHHIVGVYDGSRRKVYIDGVLYHDIGDTGLIGATDDPVAIGVKVDDGSVQGHHRGLIDDVRVYRRALSAAEVKTLADPARLAAAGRGMPAEAEEPKVAPRTAAPSAGEVRRGLVGYWTFDEGRGTVAMDMSGRGANGTVRGGRWIRGRIGAALEFRSTNTGCAVAPPLDLARRSFTLSAWARRVETDGFQVLLSQGDADEGKGLQFGFRSRSHFTLGFWNDDLTTEVGSTDSDWHHWAATFDSDSGARTIYRDGVAVASDVAKAAYVGSGPVDVGGMRSHPVGRFHGAIDDVRIHARALGASEIRALANPARHAAADVRRGLLAHWAFDEGQGVVTEDSSGNGVKLDVGNAKWTRGRVGGAIEFDAAGENVSVPAGPDFDITTAITVAAWVKVNSFNRTWQAVVAKGDTSWRLHRHGNSNLLNFTCNGLQGNFSVMGATNVNDGQWHHVAGVYDGSRLRLYVDGDEDGTAAASGTVWTNDADVRIGSNSHKMVRNWDGAIDDVRVYNRALSAGEIGSLADPTRLAAAANAAREAARKAAERAKGPPPPGPFDLLLGRFDALVRKGDHAGARKLMTDAAKDPELADRASAVTAAVKVCESLVARERAAAQAGNGLAGQEVKLDTRKGQAKGKVKEASADGIVVLRQIFINRVAAGETKHAVRWADISPEQVTELAAAGGWRPKSPDDHVALAVLAILWRKHRAAAGSLDAAGDHPLVEPYRGRLGRE